MNYIGIDISKDSFVAAYSHEKGSKTQTYKNTPEGVRKFIKTIDREQHHCVMEATGNYCFLLLYMLIEQGYKASLINPKQIKYFAKTTLSVTKTDAQDAILLSLYGKSFEPPIYKMPSESIIFLKQKRTVIRQLKKQRVASENLKKSIDVLPYNDKKTLKILTKTITFLNNQINNIEKEFFDVATTEFNKQISLLTSIKGIGMAVATSLIIATGGFSFFDNPKQISRYIGICPTYQHSGTSVNIKGAINRNGDTALRSTMFLAAITAIRCNSACKEFYTNLRAKGKPAKLAIIAVANKLIRQAFAIIKSETPYKDGFVSKVPNQHQLGCA